MLTGYKFSYVVTVVSSRWTLFLLRVCLSEFDLITSLLWLVAFHTVFAAAVVATKV